MDIMNIYRESEITVHQLNDLREKNSDIQILDIREDTERNHALIKDSLHIKLTEIAKANEDIEGVSLYALGSYRKDLNNEQKKEYTILFEEYFIKTFVSRLTDYSEPKIDVISAEKKNEKYTIVSSILLATDKKAEIRIDWRVYTKNPDKPLIRDLIIEGLSLARVTKEEFSSIIESNDGNINALFSKLKEFINS